MSKIALLETTLEHSLGSKIAKDIPKHVLTEATNSLKNLKAIESDAAANVTGASDPSFDATELFAVEQKDSADIKMINDWLGTLPKTKSRARCLRCHQLLTG